MGPNDNDRALPVLTAPTVAERDSSQREHAPQTWHYGIVAKWWAEFNVDGKEIGYFRRFIEQHGQPALDAACGTGRLLVPYLQAGLDVDGTDISQDMLSLCRARAERVGATPNLYAQAMHELDLPRRYRTIIFCGGLGLGGDRSQDLEGLRRLYEHLEPGGVLALDNEVPYNYTDDWRYWLSGERNALPMPWRGHVERRRGSDGAEYALESRLVDLDPLSQCITYEMHATMWRDGVVIGDEKRLLKMTLYFRDEVVLMLERSGFTDVVVRGSHNDTVPTADDDFLVFIATKPA